MTVGQRPEQPTESWCVRVRSRGHLPDLLPPPQTGPASAQGGVRTRLHPGRGPEPPAEEGKGR